MRKGIGQTFWTKGAGMVKAFKSNSQGIGTCGFDAGKLISHFSLTITIGVFESPWRVAFSSQVDFPRGHSTGNTQVPVTLRSRLYVSATVVGTRSPIGVVEPWIPSTNESAFAADQAMKEDSGCLILPMLSATRTVEVAVISNVRNGEVMVASD
jgi:hypothetical protein